MAEKKVQKTKVQSDQLLDSDTPDEEVDPQLRTSEEERIYGTIRGSAQATLAVFLTYKGAEQFDGGKRLTTVTQNKEAF